MTAAELYAMIDVLKRELLSLRTASDTARLRATVDQNELEMRLRLAEKYIPAELREQHAERDESLRRSFGATRGFR